MQTPRVTRSSVLGKRGHQQRLESSPITPAASKFADQLQTPDSTPQSKRPRTSVLLLDGEGNKENVPPFSPQLLTPDPSPVSTRPTRALRRSGTEIVSPTRSRPAVRRHASTSILASSDSPSDPFQFSFATLPPSPLSSLPLHARARALLRTTCNNADNGIAGRDAERATIRDFITAFVDDSSMETDTTRTTLYISGSPGCGKTALVNTVLRELDPTLNNIKVIFINCMALDNLEALWERMFEELNVAKKQRTSYSKCPKYEGRKTIKHLLSGLRTKCVLVLDELDHITPNVQALTSLFSLPDATPSYLRLIGIANTHTLTSNSSSSLASSLNVHTVHFAPYTSNQLLQILQVRLRSFYEIDSNSAQGDSKKFLPDPSLTLLSKKVAGLTGDVRCLFEVLRNAIDIAVAPSKPNADVRPSDTIRPAVSVTPSHILAALKAYKPSSSSTNANTSPSLSHSAIGHSEIVTKAKNLNLQARLVLLSVLLASKRLQAGLNISGSAASPKKTTLPLRRTSSANNAISNLDISHLYAYYITILTRGDSGVFEPAPRSEFGDLLNVLEVNGLVCLSSVSSPRGSPGRRPLARSASMGATITAGNAGIVRLADSVWCDEILRGLGVNGSASTSPQSAETDVCEEELKNIWQREQMRLIKDAKTRDMALSKGNAEDVFAGAVEN